MSYALFSLPVLACTGFILDLTIILSGKIAPIKLVENRFNQMFFSMTLPQNILIKTKFTQQGQL